MLMCATYVIKAHKDILKNRYGVSLPEDFEGIDERIVPFKTAPVIVNQEKKILLKPMQFSLIPPWSKDSKPKFATFNARVEDIDTKPTWKDSFKKRHCIVPITNFIEPIYTGDHAGQMVAFNPAEILSAAGIYSTWVNSKTGELLDSFAIIMTDALPFVNQVGHSRSPFFITNDAVQDWIRFPSENSQEMKEFLFQKKAAPLLHVTTDRPMANGWEKRIPKK